MHAQHSTCRPVESQKNRFFLDHRCRARRAVGPTATGANVCIPRRPLLVALSAIFLTPESPAKAEEGILGVYNSAAEKYDELDDGPLARLLGLSELRQRLIRGAYGKVLEVGIGTGINLPLYNPGNLVSFTGLDLSSEMLSQADQKLQRLELASIAHLEIGNVEILPFQSGEFDCVVSTFSLCVFQKPALALKEMVRVVKPDGKVLLLEHSRSNVAPLAWYQDVTEAVVTATSKGCVWNQNLMFLIGEAGLSVTTSEEILAGLVQLVDTSPFTSQRL